MSRPVNIRPESITLRVCLDLKWDVTSFCRSCGCGRQMDLAKAVASPLAATPIYKLLEAGAIKCRAGRCKALGTPCHFLTVSWLNVGRSIDMARWSVETVNGRRAARLLAASD